MLHLILLTLLPGAPADTTVALTPDPAPEEPTLADGGLDELRAEYERAVAEWRAEFEETENLQDRAQLRKRHPAHAFWDRFQALAGGGEGRALLWMLENTGPRFPKRSARGEAKTGLYEKLFADHGDAEWIGDVVARLPRDARDIGAETAIRHVEAALERASGNPFLEARATLSLAALLVESDEGARHERGKELLRRYEKENIAVGATAIDFPARTIDGHSFKLSDYRGKVVLVDFYGFW